MDASDKSIHQTPHSLPTYALEILQRLRIVKLVQCLDPSFKYVIGRPSPHAVRIHSYRLYVYLSTDRVWLQ